MMFCSGGCIVSVDNKNFIIEVLATLVEHEMVDIIG